MRNFTRYRHCTLHGKLYRASPSTPLEVSDDNGKTWAEVPRYQPVTLENVHVPEGYQAEDWGAMIAVLPKQRGIQ